MHPEVVSDKPGMCSECGMNLIPAKKKKTAADADRHAGHKTESFLRKFLVVSALTVPILAYSELFEKVFERTAPKFSGSEFVILAFGSIIFFYGGWIFLASARRELKARLPGMMTLIALAITAAYSFSVFAVLTGREHTLFWELSTLIAVMLLGHWIEMRAVAGAQGALKELAKLLPDTAEVIRGNATEIIPIAELKIGDVMLVKPGGKVPADGKIAEGRSELNESIITGESKPVSKQANDELIAGSINGDGTLKVSVTKIGEHTFLAGVMRLVADAQASKSRLQMLSDRAAFYLTVLAVAAGGITLTLWLLAGAGIVFATERLVAVLVIACPHALGLAIPLVASISTTMAARGGLLVRQRLALEAARKINVVLFDKTGTLTKGEFGVDAIIANDGGSEDNVLQLAASVNSHSEHPLAKAMVSEARKRQLLLTEVKDFERIPSGGAKGWLEGTEMFVGNERLLAEKAVRLHSEFKSRADILSRQGKTVIYVIAGNALVGSIALVDVIREESREAVKALKELGVKVAMVTGDSEDVAKWVSDELGVDEYFAKVLPHEKSEKVRILQSKGYKVAMVGDGVNDAPALTQADLGIAIGAGTNVAIESAGIILVKSDPRDIPKIIKLSRLTYGKMIQNLFWATAYNIVALPLAAGALVFKGIILEPAVAAVFMSLSTVIVAFNAVLLRKQKL
ncbi:MAG: copper-translocating P-type ATPase [Candidatus Liptonbacteria bacterium]|nr:copper-translocating P-type ATPase [Candidatus Liptonbacteria bacterium]